MRGRRGSYKSVLRRSRPGVIGHAWPKNSRQSRGDRLAGTVPRVSPITSSSSEFHTLDFQSATPLSPRASQLLEQIFAEGWLEPAKIHHASGKLRNLIEESKESLASGLGVAKGELEFVGELGFGFWAAIAGALKDFRGDFIYSSVDRQIVHAFAREQAAKGLSIAELPVSVSGRVDFQAVADRTGATVFWQATNRETGIEQLDFDKSEVRTLIADMTASFLPNRLPKGWDIAIWDPRNFSGPEGLGIIAIRDGARWSAPIPEMGPRRLFGSFSKPLLILSAVALEEHLANLESNRVALMRNNSLIREYLARWLPDIKIVGQINSGDPRYIALVIDGVVAEELLRNLEVRGVLVDAGSACSAGALSPSHVLTAMGYGVDGQIRLTLKADQGEHEAQELVQILKDEIESIRSR